MEFMKKMCLLVILAYLRACSCFSEQGTEEWGDMVIEMERQELRWNGRKAADDLIRRLPGQPSVDVKNGRTLFYYFAEAEKNPESKPLLLGCSSMMGAMAENGVNPDGMSLYRRHYAWNRAANILFLESPAGVGFSYSNTSSDYSESGDKRTARDSYVFLVKWLQRFPAYIKRDFYIAGESYAGHYIPELAEVILKRNKVDTSLVIQLRGIMVGNGLMNMPSDIRGNIDFVWSHA